MTEEQAQQMIDAIEKSNETLKEMLRVLQELPEITAAAIARELGVTGG